MEERRNGPRTSSLLWLREQERRAAYSAGSTSSEENGAEHQPLSRKIRRRVQSKTDTEVPVKGTKIEAATQRHRKRTQTPGSPMVVVSLPLSSPRQRSAPEMTRRRRSVSVAETSPLAQLKPTVVKLQLDSSSQPPPPIRNPPAPKSEPPAAGPPPLPADLPAVEWTSRGTIKWSGAKTDTQTLPANQRAPIKRLPIEKALTHIQPIAGAPRIKSIKSRTYTQVCASVPPRLRASAPSPRDSTPPRLCFSASRIYAFLLVAHDGRVCRRAAGPGPRTAQSLTRTLSLRRSRRGCY